MKHMFRHGIMTKADFWLIAAVLVLACVILAGRLFGRPQEGWVVVSRSGVEEEPDCSSGMKKDRRTCWWWKTRAYG